MQTPKPTSSRCSVCSHADREAIDVRLVAGDPVRDVASSCGLKRSAVQRHKTSHLAARLAKAQQAQESTDLTQAESLLAEVERLKAEAQAIQAQALASLDLKTALTAIREQGRLLELLAKMLGQVASVGGSTVHVHGPAVVQMTDQQLAHELRLAARAARILDAAPDDTFDVGADTPESVEIPDPAATPESVRIPKPEVKPAPPKRPRLEPLR